VLRLVPDYPALCVETGWSGGTRRYRQGSRGTSSCCLKVARLSLSIETTRGRDNRFVVSSAEIRARPARRWSCGPIETRQRDSSEARGLSRRRLAAYL
jgi:hypothetical protein